VTGEVLYRLSGVWKDYGDRRILDIPSLEIYQGELFCLVGPSGAGKSTLLRLLHFLEPVSGGHIQFKGLNLSYPLPLSIRRTISMVFQRPELLNLSVWDNVALGLQLRGKKDRQRVWDALEAVELLDLKDAPANTLSGGEVQRVALARVMVLLPEVLLLDEPTANLDPYHVALVENVVRDLHQRNGTSIILVTHNVFQARRLAERVGLLLGGQIIEVAETETFFQSPSDPRSLTFVRGEMIY
jgi:tungstate transport system ATP-binding protein